MPSVSPYSKTTAKERLVYCLSRQLQRSRVVWAHDLRERHDSSWQKKCMVKSPHITSDQEAEKACKP